MAIQIVSDGPDRYEAYMRNGVMRLMLLAKKKIMDSNPIPYS